MKPETLLTVQQFARKYGLSRPTVYKYISEGRIKTVVIAGKKLIDTSKMLIF